MDKMIFVTVEEFLANGGVLDTDRALFSENDFLGYYDSTFDKEHFENMIRIKKANGTFPAYPMLTYVKIYCTPIYK